MASSSSSASSAISFESRSSREPTPEYDPVAAYEILAPLHWGVEEWDFQSWSEDDESLTDGEDLCDIQVVNQIDTKFRCRICKQDIVFTSVQSNKGTFVNFKFYKFSCASMWK
jgi:hypothetical protein